MSHFVAVVSGRYLAALAVDSPDPAQALAQIEALAEEARRTWWGEAPCQTCSGSGRQTRTAWINGAECGVVNGPCVDCHGAGRIAPEAVDWKAVLDVATGKACAHHRQEECPVCDGLVPESRIGAHR